MKMGIQKKAKLRTIKCKWCGKPFTIPSIRKYNARKYCSVYCKRNAYLEQHLKAVKRYNKKKGVWQLHLGISRLRETPKSDFDEELKAIESEMRRLRIK